MPRTRKLKRPPATVPDRQPPWWERHAAVARAGGLVLGLGFLLPWCDQQTGLQMARTGLQNTGWLWLIPGTAILILLLPFALHGLQRAALQSILAVAALAVAITFAIRVGKLRGIGIYVSSAGALVALVEALWIQFRWSFGRLRPRKEPPP